MKLGIDIIEIERIQMAIERNNAFIERVYTPIEVSYCKSKGKHQYEFFAGLYAAKEAFLKALGTGMRYGSWQEIQIDHDELGAPYITISGVFKNIFEQGGYSDVQVSISHCQNIAMAQVILSK